MPAFKASGAVFLGSSIVSVGVWVCSGTLVLNHRIAVKLSLGKAASKSGSLPVFVVFLESARQLPL